MRWGQHAQRGSHFPERAGEARPQPMPSCGCVVELCRGPVLDALWVGGWALSEVGRMFELLLLFSFGFKLRRTFASPLVGFTKKVPLVRPRKVFRQFFCIFFLDATAKRVLGFKGMDDEAKIAWSSACFHVTWPLQGRIHLNAIC